MAEINKKMLKRKGRIWPYIKQRMISVVQGKILLFLLSKLCIREKKSVAGSDQSYRDPCFFFRVCRVSRQGGERGIVAGRVAPSFVLEDIPIRPGDVGPLVDQL
jgi:hypothetical protein